MGEVIDEGNGACAFVDVEFDDVAMEEFRSSCLIFIHSPGAGVMVAG